MKYRMTLEVPPNMVSVVFDVLKDEGIVVNTEAIIDNNDKKARPHHYAGGKRFKGISGTDLALQALTNVGTVGLTRQEFEDVFQREGFAKKSYSPIVSELVADKKVVKGTDMRFRLVSMYSDRPAVKAVG